MNDLDLLERLREDVEPLGTDSRERIRSLVDERIESISAVTAAPRRGGSPTTSIRRRGGRIAIIAVAAVLLGAAAASGFANRLWTNDRPVAIPLDSSGPSDGFSPDIPHPSDAVSLEDFPATISEFAPAIRLPAGGSFDEWTNYVETYWQRLSGLENNRASVVGSMTRVASCQWMQHWLTATSASDDAAAAQAIRVLPGIEEWQRAAGMIIDPGGSDHPLAEWMRDGSVPQVQSAENECGFTGSWGDTVAEQDAKATGDLEPAIAAVRSALRGGAAPRDFDWHTGDSIAHSVNWTDATTQPGNLFPGYIYIAPTTEEGVMLISTSESGTRFCAVITDTTVEQGTVNPQRFPPDPDSINTPFDSYPGPVACTPGAWPS